MFVLALGAAAVVVSSFPRGKVEELQSAEGGLGQRRTVEAPQAESVASS
jgi:hypothetical protein